MQFSRRPWREIEKGWADGPWPLEALEQGATISRRFPLQQGDKVRMIDDYRISGVNDSCTLNSKLDLHVVDTFVATIKAFFQAMNAAGRETLVLAKTYDLKSAYRQVPVLSCHLKFAYFCIYNHEKQAVESTGQGRSLSAPLIASFVPEAGQDDSLHRNQGCKVDYNELL